MNILKYKFQAKLIRSESGFTLIELIMVVAIMVIILSLTIPAFVGISASRDINKAVNTAESIASVARQQALTKGTMVALLLSPASTATISNPQEFILLQSSITASGTTAWAANSPWVKLPADIQVTPLTRTETVSGTATQVSSFYTIPTSGPAPVQGLPQTLGSQSLTNFSFIVFYSDGSVLSQTPGPAINLQRITKSGTIPDYMVLIPEASGRAKVNAMQ